MMIQEVNANQDTERQKTYGEVRMIYYNSCRGLEEIVWSVACFDIDIFFDKKRAEADADKIRLRN